MRVQDLGKAASRQLGRFGIQGFGMELGSREPAFWQRAGASMPSRSSKSIFGGRQERKLKIAGHTKIRLVPGTVAATLIPDNDDNSKYYFDFSYLTPIDISGLMKPVLHVKFLW